MNTTIRIEVTEDQIEEAHERRRQGIALYGHLPNTRNMTPDQWVGDLGEIIMEQWLNQNDIRHVWFSVEEQRTKPDFLIKDELHLEVKTCGRNFFTRDDYEAGVNLEQYERNDNTDEYFFMSYHKGEGIMELLGYMPKEMFGRLSVIQREGEMRDNGRPVLYDERIVKIKQVGNPRGWMAMRAI